MGLVYQIVIRFRPSMLKEGLDLEFKESGDRVFGAIFRDYVGRQRKNSVMTNVSKG